MFNHKVYMQCLKKQVERSSYDYLDNFYITCFNTTYKWNGFYKEATATFEIFSQKTTNIKTS